MPLTDSQQRVLEELASHGDWRFSSRYNTRSLVVLARKRYIEAPYGLWQAKVRITREGREALEDGRAHPPR